MPEERGSIYKSTANEIGEALKAKLGGEGFAPKDWSDNLNLLGIASEDTEAAINSLKESEGSGERGSILLSTANAIGSMLNKKYNSQRGFSPAEWASATRKMKALETDTKSGGIVNLKGAKEVPITSLVGTINPNLEGVSSVDVVATGKNLFDNTGFPRTVADTNYYGQFQSNVSGGQWKIPEIHIIPDVQYTLSFDMVSDNEPFNISAGIGDGRYLRDLSNVLNLSSGRVSVAFSITKEIAEQYGNVLAFRAPRYGTSRTFSATISNIQLEVGSTATTYEPYTTPTTYTAQLGVTIFGGYADVINGSGKEQYAKRKVSDFTWQKQTASGRDFYLASSSIMTGSSNKVILCDMLPYGGEITVGAMEDKSLASWQKTLRIYDTDIDDVTELISTYGNAEIVYPLETERDFTFDPIPINTSGDTENLYTSHGDTAITYYEEPTAYTRGTASGMIASIPEANTEFPFTKLKATIAPSVEGVSSVVVKNDGKNLFSFEKDQTITRLKTFNLRLLAGSYTFSWDFISTTAETLPVYMQVSFLCDDGTTVYNPVDVIQGRMTRSFTLAKNVTSINIYANTNYTTSDGITTVIENIQLEVGSSATAYTAYKTPTVYTAELGETVYGGSVDLVSGEVVKTYKEITVGNSGWTFYDTGSGTYLYKTVSDKVTPSIGDTSHILVCDMLPYGGVNYASQFQDLNVYQANNQNIYIKDNSCTSASDYYTKYANMKIGYELATPTEASIEPQEIYPNEGVNNIWNNANGITEVGYFGD